MKKFAAVIFLSFAFLLSSTAQVATLFPLIAGDTVTDATVTVIKSITSTKGHSAVTMQVVLTKVSGTVAGTTKLQGSLNGTNWEDIGSAFTHTDVASQAKAFTQTGGSPYTFYRTITVGTGTMKAQVRVYYVKKD